MHWIFKLVLRNGQSYTFVLQSEHAEALSFAASYNYMLQLKSFNHITWDVMDINQCPRKPQDLTDLKNRTAGKHHPSNHWFAWHHQLATASRALTYSVRGGNRGGDFQEEILQNVMFAQLDAMIGCMLFESFDWWTVSHLTFILQTYRTINTFLQLVGGRAAHLLTVGMKFLVKNVLEI